jgi:hypothetical protein
MNFACLFVYVYFFFPENLNAVKHFDLVVYV